MENVISRILPVKIHDLDGEDLAIIENELGGALRHIEFIYRSAGVNRPLTSLDNPDKKLSNTFYRDQINKVANGVKQIMVGLKHFENPVDVTNLKSKPDQSSNILAKTDCRKVSRITVISIVVFLIAGYFLFNLVTIISLPEKEQMPLHKLIFPLGVLAIAFIVGRQPVKKMGFMLMQIAAASVFGGGLADILFTFTSSSMPHQYSEFLHLNPENISPDLVKLRIRAFENLGYSLDGSGIGG